MAGTRSDAVRNRTRLVHAATTVFAAQGVTAPLEAVAAAADVSRATLYRHFPTRADLAAAVYEENLNLIEAQAARLTATPSGLRELFGYVLDLQERSQALLPGPGTGEHPRLDALAARTAAAFAPLVAAAHERGEVHAGVGVDDVLLALQLAQWAATSAPEVGDRHTGVRRLLDRGLFT